MQTPHVYQIHDSWLNGKDIVGNFARTVGKPGLTTEVDRYLPGVLKVGGRGRREVIVGSRSIGALA
jgi:hypothetical protein